MWRKMFDYLVCETGELHCLYFKSERDRIVKELRLRGELVLTGESWICE
jgi:hypothetical protein